MATPMGIWEKTKSSKAGESASSGLGRAEEGVFISGWS
jgi:hypothetical protein